MNTRTLLPIIVILLSSCASSNQHQEATACSERDSIYERINARQYEFFSGWSVEDYDRALTLNRRCRSMFEERGTTDYVDRYLQGSRRALVMAKMDHEQKVHDDEKKAEEERKLLSQRQDAIDALRAKNEAQQAKIQRLNQCLETKQNKLYESETSIINDVETITFHRKYQNRLREVSQESGVRNLGQEYYAGEMIVSSEHTLKNHFAEYQRLGGLVQNPSSVKHASTDPCMTFR